MQLSLVQPDFASIRDTLQRSLAQYKSWTNILPTSTGQTIMDWIAAVGANDMYAIEHAFRESYRTARVDSSILAQAILLGVRITRKSPSYADVTLKNAGTTSVTIPAYSSFSSSVGVLFNRDALLIPPKSEIYTPLYEGNIVTKDLTGTGESYQMYASEEAGFIISDADVKVRINNVDIPRFSRGLWTAKTGEGGYQDTTTTTGQLLITFGAGVYGSIPKSTDNVILTYAITKGVKGNSPLGYNSQVSCSNSLIVGKLTSGLKNGADEQGADLYRRVGPNLFAARRSATTSEEYSAVPLQYQGVIDARALGQRSIAPDDPRWMNVVQMSLLTETPLTAKEWEVFEKWFKDKSIFTTSLYRSDPIPVDTDISLVIHCQGSADLTSIQAVAGDAIRELFAPRSGIIDLNIFLSDIHTVIRGIDAAIEYVTILSPTQDIITQATPPTITPSVTSGSLTKGQYTYGVSIITTEGEGLPANFCTIIVPKTGGVRLEWDTNPQAIGYRVYGRSLDNMKLVGTTSGSDGVFEDTGLPLEGSINKINRVGHRYPRLRNLSIEARYTNRKLYTR